MNGPSFHLVPNGLLLLNDGRVLVKEDLHWIFFKNSVILRGRRNLGPRTDWQGGLRNYVKLLLLVWSRSRWRKRSGLTRTVDCRGSGMNLYRDFE